MSTHIGQIGPAELTPVKTWDPRFGWVLRPRFRGTEDALAVVVERLKSEGIRFSMDPDDDGLVTITAEGNDVDEEPLETWSLKGNDLDKSLWSLPQIEAEWAKDIEPEEDKTHNKTQYAP